MVVQFCADDTTFRPELRAKQNRATIASRRRTLDTMWIERQFSDLRVRRSALSSCWND
jgi:hypothetical protein